jgi:acyl dehydratase
MSTTQTNPPLPAWADLAVGDELPPLLLPPLSRHTLALYCGASGDHNPIHVDIDYARDAGLPDVIAHGMLSAAWLARLLTNWLPQSALRSLDIRFNATTLVGELIRCSGRVIEKIEAGDDAMGMPAGERRVRLALSTTNADGQVKLGAEATLAWPV